MPAVEVVGAHGVADGFVLRDDGFVILAVVAAFAAHIEEEFGEIEPVGVAGLAIKFHEAHLDDLVAGRDAELPIAEIFLEQRGALEADVEQRTRTGGAIVGDAGFVEMAEVVKFVAELRVFAPALLIYPAMTRAVRVHGAEGVEITIRLLRGGDAGDDGFQLRLQRGVGFYAEAERGAFDGFVNVRVVEGILRRWLDLEIGFARRATFHDFGGEVEVLDATGGFALLEREGQRDVGVGGLDVVAFGPFPGTARLSRAGGWSAVRGRGGCGGR
jgi:hypothetical protein